MPTLFLFIVVPVYHSLKPVSSTSFAFCPFHLISWTHRILTRLLTSLLYIIVHHFFPM
uniref:Glycerol-3-phosphate acyltransferase n=1 Tax=Arundo donax TaxID=35708 RepID=A0A0A9CA98_ARUDO